MNPDDFGGSTFQNRFAKTKRAWVESCAQRNFVLAKHYFGNVARTIDIVSSLLSSVMFPFNFCTNRM